MNNFKTQHGVEDTVELCTFPFWNEYFSGTSERGGSKFNWIWKGLYPIEDQVSNVTFVGDKLPDYPTLIYSNQLDPNIGGIVSTAQAAFHALNLRGSFDFESEYPVKKVGRDGSGNTTKAWNERYISLWNVVFYNGPLLIAIFSACQMRLQDEHSRQGGTAPCSEGAQRRPG